MHQGPGSPPWQANYCLTPGTPRDGPIHQRFNPCRASRPRRDLAGAATDNFTTPPRSEITWEFDEADVAAKQPANSERQPGEQTLGLVLVHLLLASRRLASPLKIIIGLPSLSRGGGGGERGRVLFPVVLESCHKRLIDIRCHKLSVDSKVHEFSVLA